MIVELTFITQPRNEHERAVHEVVLLDFSHGRWISFRAGRSTVKARILPPFPAAASLDSPPGSAGSEFSEPTVDREDP